MKKAFTLIELLVVIAIIAILAAILFPVFAQAKTAAKKTQSISNIKQIGTAILIYSGDYDDRYPRNDDCIDKAGLNSALYSLPYNPGGVGCATPPFYNRANHYKWQRWLMPYVKNTDMYFHPRLQKDSTAWANNGEIMNGYGINLALTGALNTYGTAAGSRGRWRDSFLGGTQTAVPDVSAAWIIFELASTLVNYAPVFTVPNTAPAYERQTAFPSAQREVWAPMFYKWPSQAVCSPLTTQIDAAKTPWADGIVLGRADSSAKFYPINRFLAETPTAAQYPFSNGWPCGPTGGSWSGDVAPTWTQPWPLWALQ